MGFPANGDSTEKTLKFQIYDRTGWIGGVLGKDCQVQGINFAYGSGCQEIWIFIEIDACTVQGERACPQLLINYATCYIFEYDAPHFLEFDGFKEEDSPIFIRSFYSNAKAMFC